MGGSGPGGVKEGLRQGLRARDLMRVEWEEKRGRGQGGDSAGWRLPPDLHCSSFLQIPEEVGLTWDPRSQAPSTPEPAPGARTTCTRAGRAWVAWGCWVDEWASTGRSAGVRWKGGRVGWPWVAMVTLPLLLFPQLLSLWDTPHSRTLLPGLLRADRSPFCARRDVSRRCRLRPGHYLVVPSAARAGDEADFTLRIFSERRHTAV